VTEQPSKPGWYPHPDMVNTLCYWGGEHWTDKVQPMSDDTAKAVDNGVKRIVGAIIAIVIIILVAYFAITADDDVDAAPRPADHDVSGS
jgi:hypothetical protein